MMSAYYRRLAGTEEEEKLRCALAWSSWEMATARLKPDPELLKKTDNIVWSLQFARIEWCVVIVSCIFYYLSHVL